MADSSRDETLIADSFPSSPSLPVQARVGGRFEILALVGSGGMGTVYKARDVELDEIVALKVLRRELVGSSEMLERFRQELKLARRVTHRNVARAFDIGEHEGERFLTMEFVEGQSLGARLNERRTLTLAEIVELGIALAAGLAAAHGAGIVHRDLKPDNIIVAPDGRYVITDFGIARAKEGNAARTQGGVLVGTPAYMAPEQVEGKPVDGRTDLFSLGVILFELATGRLPWSGDTPIAAAAARLVSPPRDARAMGVGEPLAALLDRCLAREPRDRPATAEELASMLRALPPDVRLGADEAPSITRTQTTPVSRPVAAGKSVAVLPFKSGKKDDEYLAEGLEEDLVDQLSTTPGLRVKPRGAVVPHAGKESREAGLALDVDVVVEGSLRRMGDDLRINVRIIDTASGFQLWAKRFDRPASDVLKVSDEVAQATAAALTVEANGAERHAPTNPRALDLLLRGRHEYQRFSTAGASHAVELFTEADKLTPDDPQILSGLSLAHVRMWFFGGEGSADRARECADRAIALAPTRGEPYGARGAVRFQDRDFVGAVRDLRKALSLSPANADAHDLLGRIAAETGPTEDATYHLHTAISLDPGFASEEWTVLRVLALAGKWREADRLVEERLKRPIDAVTAWNTIARHVSWKRDAELAKRLLTREDLTSGQFQTARMVIGFTASPEPGIDPLGFGLQGLGATNASWRTRSFLAQLRAEVSGGTGDAAAAIDAIERAVVEGLVDLAWIDGCPLLSEARRDARFPALRAVVAERAAEIRSAMLGPVS